MRNHFQSTTIMMILSLVYYGVQYALGQIVAIEKSTCEIQFLARSYFNQKEYVTLCAECRDQYVLSFDLQTCILYTDLGLTKYQYCKRLGRDGETCIEALCTIQLNEIGEFVSVQSGNNNENCAQFDSKTGDCIYPRLNFELDLDTQIIIENTETFCALRKSVSGVKTCIEYHNAFIDTKLGYSVFPDQFYNTDKIDFILSTHIEIICIKGYEIIRNTESSAESTTSITRVIIGCRIIFYEVTHCIAYHVHYRYCVKCEEGYSLNINHRECIKLNHCVSHKIVYGQYICLKCEIMYYLYNGQCIYLKYCVVQDASSSCAFCVFPYFGYRCENINKTIPDECELLNRYGNCVKCKNNEINFWHIFHQRCELRKLSIHCIHKSYISDQCDSFECESGYYFNAIHYEAYYGVFRQYQAYSCEYLKQDTKQNYYWYWYDYNYYDYGQLMNSIRDVYYFKYHFNLGTYEEQGFCIIRQKIIDGCLIYDQCFESCLECATGFSLVQDSSSSDFYYRFICEIKVNQTNIIIKKIEFCIKYDSSNGNCLACEDYYTNYFTECQVGTIKNCRVYGDQNICLQCETNFALFNNQCFYVEYCLEYQWIKINLFCTKCIERPDTAISLVQTSNLFRSDCVVNLPLDFCAHFVDNICVRCIRGYVLILGINKCIYFQQVKGGLHCQKAYQSLHCSECIAGYRLVTINGVSSCVRVNGSCIIRKTCDVNRCTIDCQGLYINYQPTCKYQCPQLQGIYYGYCINCVDYYGEGCQSCNSFQMCDRCSDGYYWDYDQRRCKYICANGQIVDSIYQCNNCRVQNCANCSTPDECIGCTGNLFLENNKCVEKCSENYQSFIGTPPQVNICYQCVNGGCAACALDTQMKIYCTKCAEDLFLDNGKCVDKCTYYQLGQNCTNICNLFVLDGQCVEKCPFYYVQKFDDEGTFARICVTNCETYIYEDNQLECANGNCRGGYYANQSTMQCQKCKLEHCISCLNGVDQCGLCANGYYLKDGICWYVCEDSLRLVRDPFDCLRCYQRGCTNDCFYDGICTTCAENYLLENNVCRCPTEKGFTLEYPGICRPPLPPDCLDPNCISCSPYSYCHECQPGFYLIYLGINAAGLEINSCVQVCPPGYYLSNGICYPCSAHCVSCVSYELCRQCADGYVAVVKRMIPGRSIFSYRYEYMIQCLFRCRDGTLVYSPSQCRCHYACKLCEDGICRQCNEGFSLGIDNNCNGTTCLQRKCKQCDANNNQICSLCDIGYQPNENGICRYICPDGTLSKDDNDTCIVKAFCLVPNCASCPYDNAICVECEGVFTLVNNVCIIFCWGGDQDWEYADDAQQKMAMCIPCPFQCATCDLLGNCLSCKGNTTLENKCMCIAGYVFHKDKCIKKCPFYSQTINNYCSDGLHPYHTVNRLQRQCEKVEDFTSNFCIQNIENIPDILTVSMDEIVNGANTFQLRLVLEETPSICYSYLLRGKNDQVIEFYIIEQNQEALQLGVTLPLLPELGNIVECNELICIATIEIYFAETIQYIIHIEINLQLTIIITNGIQYQGSYATFNAVCPTCIIPGTLTIKSSIRLICPANNVCDGQKIVTITNSVITIIQIIDDPRFLNNKVQPHSLRLIYINSSGQEITLFITNYLYDNTKLGTISYTFKAIALRSGTLVITSIINNAIIQNLQTRILAESSTPSDGTLYPQYKIDIQMEEVDQIADSSKKGDTIVIQEEVNNSTAIIIGAAVGGGILLLILGIVIYKIYSKKQSKKNRYLRAQSTISKISESEIPHPAIAATSLKVQDQKTIQENQQEIRIPSIAEHL